MITMRELCIPLFILSRGVEPVIPILDIGSCVGNVKFSGRCHFPPPHLPSKAKLIPGKVGVPTARPFRVQLHMLPPWGRG